MKKHLLLFISFFIFSVAVAQQYEDAVDAYPVCGNEIISFDEIEGTGNVEDEIDAACFIATQSQTKWLRFRC